MRLTTLVGLWGILSTGCASERLSVHVEDEIGLPVSNAVVQLVTMNKYIPFGSYKSKDFDHYESKTDDRGNAVVRFRCVNGCFDWGVVSSNHYPHAGGRGEFKGEDMLPLPYYRFDEHEKNVSTVLWSKRNPRPMVAWCNRERRRTPQGMGRFGFDLKVFDWLPPHGHGEKADFYYVQVKENAYSDGELVGKLEFEGEDGAYIGKKNGNASFPSVYEADAKATYKKVFPSYGYGKAGRLLRTNFLTKDEYMVVRSRVEVDEQGRIMSAHYAKILGPFLAGNNYIVAAEVVFNPDRNDVNLEFDVRCNLNSRCGHESLLP